MPGYNHKGGYSRKKNLIDQKFGRLEVIEESQPFRNKDGSIQCAGWVCKCECGNIAIIRANSLQTHKTKSCGCLNKEKPSNNITHHMSNSPLYKKYKSMKRRCFDPKSQNYKYYGGKGITICQEWLEDFMNFYNWAMENGYRDELTIERKDVNKDYEPENCCWIPLAEQVYNRTNTYLVDGVSLAKKTRELNIVNPQIARDRCKRGWSLQEAISIPIGGKNEKSEAINT